MTEKHNWVTDDLCLIEETTGVKLYGTVCTDISFIAKQLNMANKTIRELEGENEQSKMMIATLRNIVLEHEDLEKENKELKKENVQLKHDATVLICSNQEYRKKNEQLKQQLSEAKADEKQLGISFMGYKMKLIEVLQKKYDKVKGKTLYADVYTEIAEEMGVDLE